jgi:preprotein translocase subunit SecG
MWTTLLLVIHILLALALVATILLQKSEGGALGIGQGPAGFMSARGAGNALTRATAILATLFVGTSIGLAVLAGVETKGQTEVDKLLEQQVPATSAPKVQPTPQPDNAPAVPAAQ